MTGIRTRTLRASRRRLLLPIAATMVVGAVASCSNQGIGAGDNTGGTQVGLAGARLSDPFQVVLIKGLEDQAKQLDLDMLPATNANEDPAQQVTDISTLLSRGIGGLVTIPVDSDAVVPAITQANAKKVPVVTVDVSPNGGEVYMIVRADNVLMGRLACEEMGRRLGGRGTVLELQGALGSANGRDRSVGFNDCVKQQFPGLTVISKPTEWESAKATDATQSVLSSTAVNGIYMASDSVDLAGVTNVLQQQNKYRKVGEPGHVVTISIDGSPEALDEIRAGYQDALVPQPVDLYSKYAMTYIRDAMAGKSVAPGPTDHQSVIVKNDQGNLADLLPAQLVTAQNVDDKALWGNQG